MRVGEWDKEIFLGRTSYNHHYHFHSPVPGCGSSSYETYTELLKVFPFSFWHLLCALSLCVCLFVGRTVLQFTSLVFVFSTVHGGKWFMLFGVELGLPVPGDDVLVENANADASHRMPSFLGTIVSECMTCW